MKLCGKWSKVFSGFGIRISPEVDQFFFKEIESSKNKKQIFPPNFTLISFHFDVGKFSKKSNKKTVGKTEKISRWKKISKSFSPTSERGSVRCRKSKVSENQWNFEIKWEKKENSNENSRKKIIEKISKNFEKFDK
jgi:hypothetical protein